MGDIKSPRLLYLKGLLFFVMGLRGVMVWAFARAYYFVFYVIQHDIDPQFKFAGLCDFAKYMMRRRYVPKNNKQADGL